MAFRMKRIRTHEGADAVSVGNLLGIDCLIEEDDLLLLSMSDDERLMRSEFLDQVMEAFSASPDINGVLHGVRKVRLGKEGSRSGHFPSIKNALGGMTSVSLPVESRVEARFALELERDRRVRAFRSQAIKLKVPGTKVACYPDFLILDWGGQLHLKEVKQDKSRLSDKTMDRAKHLSNALQKWGVSYSVVDAFEMPDEKKYENLLWLYRNIHAYPKDGQVEELLRIPFQGKILKELIQLANERGMDQSIVHYALFIGELNVNWSGTLKDDVVVRR